jgi:hypothetical protein
MYSTSLTTTSTVMEVTTVTITVAGRRPVVPVGRSKRVAEQVVSPWQILIFLTHAHPSSSSCPSVGAERCCGSKQIQAVYFSTMATKKTKQCPQLTSLGCIGAKASLVKSETTGGAKARPPWAAGRAPTVQQSLGLPLRRWTRPRGRLLLAGQDRTKHYWPWSNRSELR